MGTIINHSLIHQHSMMHGSTKRRPTILSLIIFPEYQRTINSIYWECKRCFRPNLFPSAILVLEFEIEWIK